MYKIVEVRDKVRVPPTSFNLKVKDAVKQSIQETYECTLDPKIGFILACVEVESVGEGKIIPGDAGIFYDAVFKLLVFKPELHELVYGEVIDNTEFGSFIRIGPMDGLVHISQLMDDFVSYDNKTSTFVGKETKKTLKEGDLVKARIISISFGKEETKIGLTLRQPMLGSLVWIEEEKKKAKKAKG